MEYIVIDLETTGLNADTDEIIEIGAVRLKDNCIVDTFQTLVRPMQEIPFIITELTGIATEEVENAPALSVAMEKFLNYLGNSRNFVAHNISFEKSFLKAHLPSDTTWLDTIEISKICDPTLMSYSLGSLIDYHELENARPHRALEDAMATAELLVVMGNKLTQLPNLLWREFVQMSASCSNPLATYFNELARKNMSEILSFDAEEGVKKYSSKDFNGKGRPCPYTIKVEDIKKAFAQEKAIENFEHRAEQLEMAEKITEAFNKNYFLVAEAGTGTGKSLAYLIPSGNFATKSKNPVVVSTHTMNLQDQLWHKDIPQMQEMLGYKMEVALVKGRSNYICLRKWQTVKNNCTNRNLALYLRIAHWLYYTEQGDTSEMHLFGFDRENLYNLASHSETCYPGTCKFSRNNCFVQLVRAKAEKADILVVNHSLLISDAMLKHNTQRGVLPEYQHLIVDEAHHFDAVAQDQMTLEFSVNALDRYMFPVYRRDFRSGHGRLKQLISHTKDKDNYIDLHADLAVLSEKILELYATAREFCDVSSSLMDNLNRGSKQLRLKPANKEKVLATIEGPISNFLILISELKKFARKIIDALELDADPSLSIDAQGDFKLLISGLDELGENGQKIYECNIKNDVIWVEEKVEGSPAWFISPRAIQDTLQQALYNSLKTLVFTSATLSGGDKFSFYKDSIGLSDERYPIKTLKLESPFDYKNNCKLCMSTEIPDYNSTSEIEVCDAIARAIISSVTGLNGKTLVLFTSHNQLKNVYNLIVGPLKENGIKVLAQGISGSRTAVLNSFRTTDKACLLGSSSFWEGIDVAGESLSMVIAVRLPFMPPNSPTMEAKLEEITASGKNAFSKQSLPQAIIKFKQGFGRLIRSSSDTGIFYVLDRRIWEKGYGNSFIKALPEMQKIRCTNDDLDIIIRDFLK